MKRILRSLAILPLLGALTVCSQTSTKAEQDSLEATVTAEQNSELMTSIQTTIPINPYGQEIFDHAKEHLGKKFSLPSNPNTMNCLDLVFAGLSATFNESKKLYSVDPRDMVLNPYLGNPVEGLSPILRENLNQETFDLFQPGDVIYFLFENYDQTAFIDDPMRTHVTTIDGVGYGGWHVGLSAGENKIIHAKPGYEVQFDTIGPDSNYFTVSFDALWVARRDYQTPTVDLQN